MTLAPTTPVLIGAAAVEQRFDDPTDAVEAAALLGTAAAEAIADAVGPERGTEVAANVDWIIAMNSMTSYADPARLVADYIGATGAQTVLADIGILQTTPIAKAASAMLAGEIEMAIVCGAEAKFRALRSVITGVGVDTTAQPEGTAPDQHWAPTGDIISPHEIAAGLITPVQQYAMLENARRAHAGRSIDDHHRHVAELYAGFNAVAATNPAAWYPEPRSVDFLARPSAKNRALAFPYLKWHNSQWNVDQGAALLLCTVAKATELGVPEEQWVFPLGVVESNHMVPVGERVDLHRSAGFDAIGRVLQERMGDRVAAVEHLELYSCFPIAVQAQIDAFELDQHRHVSVTGGMAFAGGPLNNFVLQALVAMVARLRADRGSRGLVTAVSGMLTKQGASLWASASPQQKFFVEDVAAEVATHDTATLEAPTDGEFRVLTYTVRYDENANPSAVVLLGEGENGVRQFHVIEDVDFAAEAVRNELVGAQVRLVDGGATQMG